MPSANTHHCEGIMKHARTIKFLGVLTAVAGVSAAVAQALPADAAAASAQPVVINCSNQAVTRPANFTARYGLGRGHTAVLPEATCTGRAGTVTWPGGYGIVAENDEYPSARGPGRSHTVSALVGRSGAGAAAHGASQSRPGATARTRPTMTLIFRRQASGRVQLPDRPCQLPGRRAPSRSAPGTSAARPVSAARLQRLSQSRGVRVLPPGGPETRRVPCRQANP